MAEVTAKIGTKLTEQEQQSVDITKAARLTAQPPTTAVVGQDYTCACLICPYCGCIGYESQESWYTIICHCCGRHFLRR